MVVDQGGPWLPASGMSVIKDSPEHDERNRFFTKLIEEKGGRDAFKHLTGDISIIDDLLFLASAEAPPPNTPFFPTRDTFALPSPWDDVVKLVEEFGGPTIEKDADGTFSGVKPGIYRMVR